MAKNPPDERLVYLALKNVFKGPDAQLRIAKKIRKLIQKHLDEGDAEVRALITEHNIDNVCNTAKTLLQDEIFASTLRAKIRFPEVFEVSPAQSAERVASEAEAARSDADAIRDAAEGHQGTWAALEASELELARKGKGKELVSEASATRPRKRSFTRASVSIPSLYPVYIPLQIQHRLLMRVQATLEDACYEFGHRMMGDILQKEGWDCPESVELNIWARVFRGNEDKFDAEKLLELRKPFPELLDSIAQLRHTAVHRVRVSANKTQQFITEAESLATLLHNYTCARMLSRLRREAQQVIDDLGRNKDLLESILKEKLQEIDARRRELDSLECNAVEDMLREDKEYQTLASATLEQAITIPTTFQQSAYTSEHDTSSEAEAEVESLEESSFVQGKPP
ncbi:hypothetical protein BJ875DRAFT_489597 [Amylocarpus encephaloides]|uniref:Ubiquinol-cytochrome-c reductase cytochrome c1 n=1 Tax=Amylocarpus encephaloides TaxID=45428 RepID=A0A9P8C0B0_9HELO|nr:hypothetical protein BJ875DRAFT_489597 [Amylocarpus encephaloides]